MNFVLNSFYETIQICKLENYYLWSRKIWIRLPSELIASRTIRVIILPFRVKIVNSLFCITSLVKFLCCITIVYAAATVW